MSDSNSNRHGDTDETAHRYRYSDALQDINAHGYNDGYVFCYAVANRDIAADVDAYLDSYAKSFRNAVEDFNSSPDLNPDPVRGD